MSYLNPSCDAAAERSKGWRTLDEYIGAPHAAPPVPSNRLDNLVATCTSRPVVVVRAPAGYGKTTLLQEVLGRHANRETTCVWCRFDSEGADSMAVLSSLAASLSYGGAVPADPAHLLTRAVANAAADRHILLILDDAHVLSQESILWRALDHLIARLPPTVRVALGTRAKPHMKLGRLRANGCLREVLAEDLCLSSDEVRSVLARESQFEVSDSLAELVHARTAGWPACVTLLAGLIARVNPGDANDMLHRVGLPQDVYTFIAEEVASSFPAVTVEAMLRLAVLDGFDWCVAERLCGAQMARSVVDSASDLGALEAVRASGESRFRFHPLFRGFLVAQLAAAGPKRVARAHLRAARILCEVGDTGGAVDQLLFAGDERAAARLVEELAPAMIRAGRVSRLDHWLAAFSPSLMLQQPQLLALQAEVDWLSGRYRDAMDKFELCRRLAAADGAQDLADEMSLKAARCAVDLGRPRLVEGALGGLGAALDVAPPQAAWVLASLRGFVAALRGRVLEAHAHLSESVAEAAGAGFGAECLSTCRLSALKAVVVLDAAEALEKSSAALRLAASSGDTSLHLHMLSNQAWNLVLVGRYEEAEACLAECVGIALEKGLLCIEPYIESNLAAVDAGRGDLVSACARFNGVIARLEQQDAAAALADELSKLAQLVRAKNSPVRALALARRARRVAADAEVAYALAASNVEEAACLASQGRAAGQLEILGSVAEGCLRSGMKGYGAQALYQLGRCHLQAGEEDAAVAPLEAALSLFQDLQYLHYLVVDAHGDPSTLLFAVDRGVEAAFAAHVLSRADVSVRSCMLDWLSGSDGRQRARALRLVASEAITDQAVVDAAARHSKYEAASPLTRGEARLARLRLHTLGGLVIELDGRRLEKRDWRRPRARELLRLLAAQRNHSVTRDALIARFWPDAEEHRAANSAYVLVNALKKTLEPDLGPNSRSTFVVFDEGAYGLVPGSFWVDAEEYDWLAERGHEGLARGRRAEARECLLAADRLYAGDYMADDLYGDVHFAERERLRQMQQNVLRSLVEIDATDGHKEAVPHYLRRMTGLDPWNEEMWEELVKAHMALGDPKGAREAYLQACRVLADGDERAMPQCLAKLGRSLGRRALAP